MPSDDSKPCYHEHSPDGARINIECVDVHARRYVRAKCVHVCVQCMCQLHWSALSLTCFAVRKQLMPLFSNSLIMSPRSWRSEPMKLQGDERIDDGSMVS